MKIRPLHDRVLVEPAEEETKTAGGIFIPDTAKEKPARGKIVAVGNGAVGDDGKVRPMVVKKGDIVLYGKYAGSDVKVDGADYKVMRESDILAVID